MTSDFQDMLHLKYCSRKRCRTQIVLEVIVASEVWMFYQKKDILLWNWWPVCFGACQLVNCFMKFSQCNLVFLLSDVLTQISRLTQRLRYSLMVMCVTLRSLYIWNHLRMNSFCLLDVLWSLFLMFHIRKIWRVYDAMQIELYITWAFHVFRDGRSLLFYPAHWWGWLVQRDWHW